MLRMNLSDLTSDSSSQTDTAGRAQPAEPRAKASCRTSAILVSFNTSDLTIRCIEALWRELDPGTDEVIVVDNASADTTLVEIRKRWPEALENKLCKPGQVRQGATTVRIIENPTNAGFGAANNLGMALAKGRYFLLINTDAFVEPGAIRSVIDKLESNPDWGVVGPMLRNRDGSVQRSCFSFPDPKQAWREALGMHFVFKGIERWGYDADRGVDFVSGACFMIRREVYEQVGGFDERFFMYCEESDWQRRIHEHGWKIGFTPEAEVVHLGGGSNKAGGTHPEFFRSIDKYQLKHGGLLGLILFRLGMITGLLIRIPYRVARLCLGDWAGLSRSVRLLIRQTFVWGCMRERGNS